MINIIKRHQKKSTAQEYPKDTANEDKNSYKETGKKTYKRL